MDDQRSRGADAHHEVGLLSVGATCVQGVRWIEMFGLEGWGVGLNQLLLRLSRQVHQRTRYQVDCPLARNVLAGTGSRLSLVVVNMPEVQM
jgi:hypothetical protein